MKDIYVVRAVWRSEGSQSIRAFLTRTAADEFCAKCNAYLKLRPDSPTEQTQKAWNQYVADTEAWRKGHPHCEFQSGDYYDVETLLLEEA